MLRSCAWCFALLLLSPGSALAGPSVLLRTIDGIRCDAAEGTVFHIHQHLAIYVRAKPVEVPAGIGMSAQRGCLYWIHTHTPDGIIHVEAPSFRTFTLGEFFDVWGQPLSTTTVASGRVPKGQLRVYVEGRPFRGDPRAIELAMHSDIVIEAGPPYFTPKPFTRWLGN